MRDGLAYLLRGAAEDWKKANNRALFTGELDVHAALTEAADAIDEFTKIVANQDKIIDNLQNIINDLRGQHVEMEA